MASRGERKSSSDRARARAAGRELLPGLLLLAVTEVSLFVGDPDATAGAGELVWSLSPLAAIGLLAWGQVRVVRRSDEFERIQQLSAMAVGFGVLVVCLAGVGVLLAADLGDATQLTQLTFTAGVVAWIGTLVALNGRSS